MQRGYGREKLSTVSKANDEEERDDHAARLRIKEKSRLPKTHPCVGCLNLMDISDYGFNTQITCNILGATIYASNVSRPCICRKDR